jgi:hypothetical protein
MEGWDQKGSLGDFLGGGVESVVNWLMRAFVNTVMNLLVLSPRV